MGASLRSCAGIVSPSYAVYRPIQPNAVFPEFVDHLLRTKPYVAEYVCRSTGIRSSRLRLYPEKFLQIPLVLPPHEEQEQLAATIAEETLQTDYAIDRARCEIDLLREYRTRLIADVVTGKLDVRGVELPALDETEAPED
jgi:type I restriction enzyme, S subunit